MTAPRSLGVLPSTCGRVAVFDDPSADARARIRVVRQAAARLTAEFPDHRPSEVIGVVHRCRRDLAGAPPGAVPELLERLARQRLRDAVA